MDHRGKNDWALADVHDVEIFVASLPRARKLRLNVLRQFFHFARSQPGRRAVTVGRAGRRRYVSSSPRS
ncbi:hypothetical protein [Streptomyces sp. NBC_00996]|uniref:hypothetical protein n=1 Tax=Streptomyces sp. NBC_00996 TaxID=2903710 RepID=UPI0038632F69|nr:hypothetical protein OG390_40625 [Streptomyces sp. NBC_00996]